VTAVSGVGVWMYCVLHALLSSCNLNVSKTFGRIAAWHDLVLCTRQPLVVPSRQARVKKHPLVAGGAGVEQEVHGAAEDSVQIL
jgi:hypothetical protein